MAEGQKASNMTDDDPVELDTRRSAEGQMAADARRHSLNEFEADQMALRRRQEELEAQLLAEPARTWAEAAVKTQYRSGVMRRLRRRRMQGGRNS